MDKIYYAALDIAVLYQDTLLCFESTNHYPHHQAFMSVKWRRVHESYVSIQSVE